LQTQGFLKQHVKTAQWKKVAEPKCQI